MHLACPRSAGTRILAQRNLFASRRCWPGAASLDTRCHHIRRCIQASVGTLPELPLAVTALKADMEVAVVAALVALTQGP